MTVDLTPEGLAQYVASDEFDSSATYMPPRLKELLLDHLQNGDDPGIALPFSELTEAMNGGLRPGNVCLVAGYTGHGKSIFVDQIADKAADQNASVHVYMTEMTAIERGLRLLSRRTGVSLETLTRRTLSAAQWAQIIDELKEVKYGYTLVSGWDVDTVMRHILHHRWDLAVVDLIHGFAYQNERDLSATSSALVTTAKQSTIEHNGTAIVVAAHLNDGQMRDTRSPQRPIPGLHSIKGSSSLKQDADVVMFVWQRDDEAGEPQGTGRVWIAKCRQGRHAHVDVWLNKARLQFEVGEAWS